MLGPSEPTLQQLLLHLLFACTGADPGACTPTFGDQCGCDEQCLLPGELEAAVTEGVCDIDCGRINWRCAEQDDGSCAVVDGPGIGL